MLPRLAGRSARHCAHTASASARRCRPWSPPVLTPSQAGREVAQRHDHRQQTNLDAGQRLSRLAESEGSQLAGQLMHEGGLAAARISEQRQAGALGDGFQDAQGAVSSPGEGEARRRCLGSSVSRRTRVRVSSVM